MESALYGIYALIALVSEIESEGSSLILGQSSFFFFLTAIVLFKESKYNSSRILKAKHDLASHWLAKKKM